MKDEINIKRPGQILDYVDTNENLIKLFNYIIKLQEKEKSFEKGYKKGIIDAKLDNENEFIVAYKELKERLNKLKHLHSHILEYDYRIFDEKMKNILYENLSDEE